MKQGNPFNRSPEQLDKDQQARQALHGGGSKCNSVNRWFDKTIQVCFSHYLKSSKFVIGSNGYCGMTYEHTPAEGPPVAALMDYICDRLWVFLFCIARIESNGLRRPFSDKNDFTGKSENQTGSTLQRLDFTSSPIVQDGIAKAKKEMDQ